MSGARSNRIADVTDDPSNLPPGTSELSEIFGTIKDGITSLMQISIIIRNATPRDRYIQAQLATKNPFSESFDIAHVGHKFPKVDSEGQEWLKRRLGRAITQRRQYLKYCREHHDKFSRRTEGVVLSSSGNDPLTEPGPVSKSQYQVSTIRTTPTSAFTSTLASTLQPSKLEVARRVAEDDDDTEVISDISSQTSYATSVHDGGSESRLRIPSLDDITSISPFECPYCWTIQDFSSEKSWRYINSRNHDQNRMDNANTLN